VEKFVVIPKRDEVKKVIHHRGTKKKKKPFFPCMGAQEKIIPSVYHLFCLSGDVTGVVKERWWLRVHSSLLNIHGGRNTIAHFFLRIAG